MNSILVIFSLVIFVAAQTEENALKPKLEAPVVVMHPHITQSAREGEYTYLFCDVIRGIPAPKIGWQLRSGKPLPLNTVQWSNGLLKFYNVMKSNAGEYICHADNKVGRSYAIGYLKVY